jgi:hypothetical protein
MDDNKSGLSVQIASNSASRRMSAGSFTVQAPTFNPKRCA